MTRLLMLVAICLSAILLFGIQPVIAGVLTPRFGGAASVWIVCLLFFQGTLVAGYAYAWLLTSLLGQDRHQAIIHAALSSVAALLVLANAGIGSTNPSIESPAIGVLAILVTELGLPLILIAATSPLVQYWYRVASERPYRLYAVSNVASLATLFLYPVLLEPFVDLSRQLSLWQWMLCIYALLFVLMTTPRMQTSSVTTAARLSASPTSLSWWIVLPAIGTILLTSISNLLTRQIAPIPLLWVVPLGLYLLTWIVCFANESLYRRALFLPLFMVNALTFFLFLVNDDALSTTGIIAVLLMLLFTGCMICHGELARRLPAPDRLTLFYLMLAIGGMLGSLFVSIIAPILFDRYLETQIGVVLTLVVATALRDRVVLRRSGYAVAVVAAAGFIYQDTIGHAAVVSQSRSFYSHYEVERAATSSGHPVMRFNSDGIIHGSQRTDYPSLPTTYYGPGSGVGRVLAELSSHRFKRIGVVGLGVGTLAAYGRPDDDFVFYEIDPRVAPIAREHFTWLANTPAHVDIVVGDARVSLEEELEAGARKFDALIIDAYSGDAIAAHLMTREAWELYWSLLNRNGVLVIHISNLYFDLLPVLRANNVEKRPMFLVASDRDWASDEFSSRWVIVTRNPDILGAGWVESVAKSVDPDGPKLAWTDEQHSVAPLVLARLLEP